MTKQVHIHIHRTKARDAGEGEGKWITLSPSGTHVKIDKGGEITAGPKGMTGKKPSELAKKSGSTPAPGKTSEPSTQQVSKHVGRKVQPSKPGWALRADPELAAKFEAAEARSKAKKLERETGARSVGKAAAPDLTKHSQFTKADYDYLKEKGWGDPEIKKRWDEEAAQGRPPQQVNKLKPPSAFGPASGEGPREASRSDEHAPLRDVLQELREDGAGQDAARLQKALANERQGVAITSAQSIAIAKAYERASHLAYERGDQKAFNQYQEIASRYRRANAGTPQGTAAVQARIDAKKAAGKPAGEGPRGASRVGSAGPAATKTDWSKSNGDWTTAKKEGAAMFERAMSSAKTGGDRTDAALKLKAEAAEQQKNGSYLGAVVLGLVNDYFDRLK